MHCRHSFIYKFAFVVYTKQMKLILASNSPRRYELLSKLNYSFDVIPAGCEEYTNAEKPVDMVKELACHKALDVYRRNSDCCVIGCDTVVDLNGKVLGKPTDVADAKRMLNALSGKDHLVHTGVCIASPNGMWLFSETTTVTFRALTESEIAAYVSSGSAMDKAGSYGIQDSGFVDKICGDYDNVVGFPTNKIDKILQTIYKR